MHGLTSIATCMLQYVVIIYNYIAKSRSVAAYVVSYVEKVIFLIFQYLLQEPSALYFPKPYITFPR